MLAASPLSPIATKSAKIVYVLPPEVPFVDNLPNPGILPSNPFYYFKTLRDRIVLHLATNSVNRARLKLFYSRKTLANVRELLKQKKSALATKELAISNQWLEDSLQTNQAKDVQLRLEQLAALREREVLLARWGSLMDSSQLAQVSKMSSSENFQRWRLTNEVLN